MFKDCSSLIGLTLGDGWNTMDLMDLHEMFSGCSSLQSVTFGSYWQTDYVNSGVKKAVFDESTLDYDNISASQMFKDFTDLEQVVNAPADLFEHGRFRELLDNLIRPRENLIRYGQPMERYVPLPVAEEIKRKGWR